MSEIRECRTSGHFTNQFSTNEDRVLNELIADEAAAYACVIITFHVLQNVPAFAALILPVQRCGCRRSALQYCIVFQLVLKTVTILYASMNVLFWFGIAVTTAFEAFMLLQPLPVVTCLISQEAGFYHRLTFTGTVRDFCDSEDG